MWLSTVEIGAANRNPIRYGCRAGVPAQKLSGLLWTQPTGSPLLSTCQLIRHLSLSYRPQSFLPLRDSDSTFQGVLCYWRFLFFSFSRNKIGKQICNKNYSLKPRACGEAVRTSPCSVISSLVLLLRDFTIIAQKESLLAGKRLLHLLAGVEYHKHVKCYNHRLFCFTVQNFVIKKRGNLLTPAANKFFLFFFPVSAFYAENFSKQISFNAHIWTKSKFLGLSVGVENIGQGNRNTFSRELQAWKILEKGNILFRKFSKSWRG